MVAFVGHFLAAGAVAAGEAVGAVAGEIVVAAADETLEAVGLGAADFPAAAGSYSVRAHSDSVVVQTGSHSVVEGASFCSAVSLLVTVADSHSEPDHHVKLGTEVEVGFHSEAASHVVGTETDSHSVPHSHADFQVWAVVGSHSAAPDPHAAGSSAVAAVTIVSAAAALAASSSEHAQERDGGSCRDHEETQTCPAHPSSDLEREKRKSYIVSSFVLDRYKLNQKHICA